MVETIDTQGPNHYSTHRFEGSPYLQADPQGRGSPLSLPSAQVAELVDALASGASYRKVVEVQVLSWAPISNRIKRSSDFNNKKSEKPRLRGFFLIKGVLGDDVFGAIGAGGDDVYRSADPVFHGVQVVTGVLRELIEAGGAA